MMNLHVLQHVPFEGPAGIKKWALANGHRLTMTPLYQKDPLPAVETIDCLILLGGPMNIHQEDDFPWLREEKRFIRNVLKKNKKILGICLGAQLIADALGARVYANREKEIGWFPVSGYGKKSFPLPEKFTAFHWHNDTFDLPEGAELLAGTAACPNQAFSFDGSRVLALQFHLEIDRPGIENLIRHCSSEITPGRSVQSPETIEEENRYIDPANALMDKLLTRLLTGKKEQ